LLPREEEESSGGAAARHPGHHAAVALDLQPATALDLRTSRENNMSLDSMEQGRLEEGGEEWAA
jgi:hypothetical protein